MNRRTHESIPLELAGGLARSGVSTAVATWYPAEPGQAPTVAGETGYPIEAGSRFSLAAARRLRAAVTHYGPDIVHVHHFPSATHAAAVCGPRSRVRLVKTEHNDHRRQRLHQNVAVLPVFARADAVVCNSTATRESFFGWEAPLVRGKIHVIHNGVDVARVRRAEPVPLPFDGGFVVATVGRLVPQKNLVALVEAAAVAVRSVPALRLLVIGGGSQEETLRSLIAVRRLTDVVHLTGEVDRDVVYGYLAAVQGFVMASRWEGFCNAAVEAAVAGVPLAVSDLVVFHEVLGDAPIFFDPSDHAAIAAALVRLAGETRGTARHATLADRTADRFGLDAAVERHCRLYEDLMGSR